MNDGKIKYFPTHDLGGIFHEATRNYDEIWDIMAYRIIKNRKIDVGRMKRF